MGDPRAPAQGPRRRDLTLHLPRPAEPGLHRTGVYMLSGYKTYILATVTGLGAIAQYLVGDADLAATIQLVVTALMGATLRGGIATAAARK